MILRDTFLPRQWRARPLCCFAICFALGMLACDRLIAFPVWLAPVAAALLIGAWPLRRHAAAVCMCLTFLAAALLGGVRLTLALNNRPVFEDAGEVVVTGDVVSEPLYRDDGRIVCALKMREPFAAEMKLYLRQWDFAEKPIRQGQTLTMTGSVYHGTAPTNPNAFDMNRYLLANGFDGMVAAKLPDVEILSEKQTFQTHLQGVRDHIAARIEALFPNDAELLKAFILGDKSGLSENLRDDFAKAGVAHLICISGLHISVLAHALQWLLSKFFSRKTSAFATLFCVLLYGLLIGFPVSLVRATIIFAFSSIAPLLGRPSDPMTQLSGAGLCMLTVQPFNLYHSGFALSFAAYASIQLCMQPLEALLHIEWMRKMPVGKMDRFHRLRFTAARSVLQMLCLTLAAQVGTLPLVLTYYGEISALSIPINLIAVPLVMLAYPVALAATALSLPLAALGLPLAIPSGLCFDLLTALVQNFAEKSRLMLALPGFPLGLSLLFYILLVAASPYSRIRSSVRKHILPFALLASLCALTLPFCVKDGVLRVTFLDAGNADAALIRLNDEAYLIDIGSSSSEMADVVADAALHINGIFLTHPHDDHSGGLPALIEHFTPDAVYVPDGWFAVDDVPPDIAKALAALQARGIPVLPMSLGDALHLPSGLNVEVLNRPNLSGNQNELSLLLRLTYANRSFLFTGDMTSREEPEAIAACDVLKVAHHGSKSSSSAAFLSQTSPTYAVLSVGTNRYGHPSAEVLDRLEDVGATALRTDECGAITFTVGRDGTLGYDTYLKNEVY